VPAGYLEWNEPPQAAAVRELAEETGLETASEDICLLDTMFVEHPDSRYVLVMIYAVPREKTSGTLTAGSDAGATRFFGTSRSSTKRTSRSNRATNRSFGKG